MSRKRITYFTLIGLMCIYMVSCGKQETQYVHVNEVEQSADSTDDEVLYDENDYKLLLMKVTTETLVEMIVDDFDGDGQNEAFAITADPDMYASYLEDPEMSEGCMTSSFWYLSGTRFESVYLDDMDAFVYMEQGMLSDGTKYVKVKDWHSKMDTLDSYYSVENGHYKLLFSLTSSFIEDGKIISYHYTADYEGWIEEKRVYIYEKGELKLIEADTGKL